MAALARERMLLAGTRTVGGAAAADGDRAAAVDMARFDGIMGVFDLGGAIIGGLQA